MRVSGRAYVLPARGQQGIPLTTVNTERVQLEVYRIGDRNLAAPAIELGEVAIIFEAAEVGIGQVLVRAGIPWYFALEEQDVVAAGCEGLEQRAKRGGVAVAPGGAEAETENDEFHAASVRR